VHLTAKRVFCVVIAAGVLLPLCLTGLDLNLKVFDSSGHEIPIASMIAVLSDKRAVFIGESHDRYDNHLDELQVLRLLNERRQHWAVGVEFIQRRFQPAIDAYLAGTGDEHDFLRKSEYYDRWGFDYRLYRPIFQYAKDNHIPVIALNAEQELSEAVAKSGLDHLSKSDREQLPKEIDKSDTAYRERLYAVFQKHPNATKGDFDHFLEAQLTWDETMAETAANYLRNHPDQAIIVLAGGEHIAYGSGIPNRVKRRIPDVSSAIVLADRKPETDKAAADYYLESGPENLPASGKMGIVMDETRTGVIAKQITPGGAAAKAGVKAKDRIGSIDGQPIHTMADARIALLDKKPGEVISISVERSRLHRKSHHDLSLMLQ